MSEDKKVIFSMNAVSKTYPSANQPVLKDIYLSFFYGAKIGILGLNGSGKSSLLKIIAGIDKSFQGDLVFSSEYKVGFLQQEPQLDEEKTVLEVVKEGVAATVAILDEYNKINDQFGLPEVYENADKMQKLMDRQAQLQDSIDASNAWELDTQLEIAMDALRTPSSDQKISVLSGGERRRVALCRLLLQKPDVLLLQEIKTQEETFPKDSFENIGYSSYVFGQKSYNGVAFISKTNTAKGSFKRALYSLSNTCCFVIPTISRFSLYCSR